MTNVHTRYHIGTEGKPWSAEQTAQWRGEQTKKRDYFTDVVSRLMRFSGGEVFQYGELDYRRFGFAKFPLFAVKSSAWDSTRPMVLITGGVHGYETSGVHGALAFIEAHLARYSEKVNVLVLPCISPWGYETINRWTPEAVDPNRSFNPRKPGCAEAAQAMAAVMRLVQQSADILVHIDLHETTDTDNSEFIPAKAARDGEGIPDWDPIPDGFYLVGDQDRRQSDWHAAINAAVAKVTHIAPADERGTIIGCPVPQEGCIFLPAVSLNLCGGHTLAKYATTTEVYPDSPKSNDEICNRAQVAVCVSGLDFALAAQ